MAIQNRRGAYANFDPQKMKPGEFAIVQSGDPSIPDGKAVYIATAAGQVKRLASADEMTDYNSEIQIALDNAIDTIEELVENQLDTTLTQSGKPADAKAVGDAIVTATTTDATLMQAGKAADAAAVGDGLDYLQSSLNNILNDVFFKKEKLITASTTAANSNTALINNNDGTYTVGTTDYGNTTFGRGRLPLDAGDYVLFGVPNGIAYLSPEGGVRESYNNRVFENTENYPKIIHLDEPALLWVCFRSPSRPTESYVVVPSLHHLQPKVESSLSIKGVLDNNTDLNTVVTSGIYLISSDRTYINAPINSGFFIVFKIGTAVQQLCTEYGPSALDAGSFFKRDGGSTEVTTSWKKYGRLTDHSIAFFGDSIMWGRDGSASASTRVTWQIPTIVAKTLGYSCANYGVSGQGYLPTVGSPQSAFDNISTKNLSNFGALVMCYGVNDGFHVLGTWDSTDESTIMGQFNKIINHIYTQNPTMRVIVVAPFNGTNIGSYPDYWYGDRDNPPYVSRKVLSDTLKKACDYYWIPYIEQYDSPMNPKTITEYLPDGVHPNEAGYKAIGGWLANKIRGLI